MTSVIRNMKFSKKILIYSAVVFLVIVIFGLLFLQKINKNEELKKETLSFVRKVKTFIYKEATIHNPKGDMLPDQWDDNFFSIIKKINQ